jgi:hypothetical protein
VLHSPGLPLKLVRRDAVSELLSTQSSRLNLWRMLGGKWSLVRNGLMSHLIGQSRDARRIIMMKIFIFFSCLVIVSNSFASNQFEIKKKPYTEVSTHKIPLLMGREYVDLSDLSKENLELQTIQKDYERYHLVGSTFMNLTIAYVILAGTGIIRPTLAESLTNWIPVLALSGAGVTFGILSKNKLRAFSETYHRDNALSAAQPFQINYTWNF